MVIDRYSPIWGGAENQLKQLCPRLLDLGCDLSIVTRRWEWNHKAHDVIEGVPVRRLGFPNRSLAATVVWVIFLFSYLLYKGRGYEVIHTHGAAALGAVGCLAACLTGSRNVAKIATAGRIPKLLQTYFGRVVLSIFRKSDAIICMSEEIQNELKSISAPSCRIVHIPNAVDGKKFAPNGIAKRSWRLIRGFDPDDPVVLFSGRFVPRKGLDVLLDAWAQVAKTHPKARLLLLGSGRNQSDSIEEAMRRRVVNEKIANVYFEGETTNPECYLGVADIFAFPSRQEGFPNALLEASASGLAIVASQVGGVVDLIENRKRGILVPPNDAEKLTHAIMELLENRHLLDELGKNARNWTLSQYAFSNTSSKYNDLYRSLIDDNEKAIS